MALGSVRPAVTIGAYSAFHKGVGAGSGSCIVHGLSGFAFKESGQVTPEQFIAKWKGSTRSESSASIEHFLETGSTPPDLVKIVPEVVPGFPDRILPNGPKAEAAWTRPLPPPTAGPRNCHAHPGG